MNKLYSVKVYEGRWIDWCDEHWYETCDFDNRQYTYEEAKAISEQLRNHYVYKCWICSEDGEEFVTAFKPKFNESEQVAVNPVEDFECFDDDFMSMFEKKAAKL